MINFNGVLPPTPEKITPTDHGRSELGLLIEDMSSRAVSLEDSKLRATHLQTVEDLIDLLQGNGASPDATHAIGRKLVTECLPSEMLGVEGNFLAAWDQNIKEAK